MANNELPRAQEKCIFVVNELATAFKLSPPTVRKMLGDTPTAGKRGKTTIYKLGDVCTLNDVREPYIEPTPEEETIETNPDKMKPSDRRTHYQAEDLKQAAELKQRKNDIESRALIPAHEVEQALAQAFKTIALLLDTLPDALERDGMIAASDIHSIIAIIDSSREQLAVDLSSLSPAIEDMNEGGDW